jgi:hemoglobin
MFKLLAMKTDIENRNDIELLINTFYEKVKKDESLAYYFTDVVKVNWEKHLPVMYDFWENVLFYSGTYIGNPMMLHAKIHQRSPFTKEHFQHWLQLFNQSVDELYEGEHAEQIKLRANNISTVMQIKILD